MAMEIKLVAQCYDTDTGTLLEEELIDQSEIVKAASLKEFGYLHVEQIKFLQTIQDFKISRQIKLNPIGSCPKCKLKTKKSGTFKSKFHAALTDHKVTVQRTSCRCGWSSPSSIEGIYGSSMHPDLLEKQAIQGAKESYEKASKSLNAESASKRSINSHSQIYKSIKAVATVMESIKSDKDYSKGTPESKKLTANIDGGHIKAREEDRSFEAMLATVHAPENIKYINKSHNKITSKSIVGSAKGDNQQTMKKLFLSACLSQGMTKNTVVTCLADGAENCWTVANSIQKRCKKVTCILDWFHIAMKFKNIAIPKDLTDDYEKSKWHLWHGDTDKSLKKIEEILAAMDDGKIIKKLNDLKGYINNNISRIVDYADRKSKGLAFTSNLAESTVNSVINDRQKGKKKMLWSRDGAHNVIQIRSSMISDSWQNDWKKVESQIYKKAV